MRSIIALISLLAALHFAGCQSYVNSPGVARAREAKRAAFSDPLLARAYQAKPTMRFPATIAVASQASATRAHIRALSARGKLDTWQSLPHLANVASISTVLSSEGNKPDLLLREAAAKIHADAVLIIATETEATDGKILAPLTELSLGLLPNKRYELIATALAALVDTRTGYVYGTLEKSRARSGLTMAWGSDGVMDRARTAAERDAMEKLFADFPAFWRGVVAAHRP